MVCLVCAEPSADAVDLAINSDTAIPAQPAASDSQGVAQKRSLIRIGVLVKGSVADCAIRYKPTADYLTSEIKEYRFVIVPIRYDSFMDTVTHEKVDFVICNPLLYVDLHAIGKISAIATMQENFNGMNFSQLGGVVFCLRDREDIKKISSIREKSFAAVSEDSFGGWVACQAFLLEKGIDPIEDASRFAFLGTHSEVVREVAEGIYDVGAVRTGTLERMAQAGTIDMDDIRIFNVISPTDRFPFFSSTELYPEWVFAKTASVKESLANRVATVLYAMPEDSDAAYRGHYAGWVTPASYQSVRECTEKVHSPFVKKRGVWGWFHEVYGFFSVMLIGLVVAFYYVFALKRKLRATNALMDHHVEEIVVKDKLIQDLRQRVGLAVGEEHQDINIIRSDYRIEYLTPKLEKEYGPGVGQYCYEYFAGRSHPCEECSLREAIKTQQITKVRKPFAREGGQPLEVTTIPLAKSSEGVQRFGQVFCDIMLHTRKVRSLTASQEREVNSVIFKGVVSQYKKRPEKSKEFLHKACNLICEETPPKKVIDINETVQKIADLTSHVWRDIAGVSFDLAVEQPKVWATERDMRIVLANLILNAVCCLERTSFSSNYKGMITFSTRVQGGTVFLMVMDNGDGRNFMTEKEMFAKPGDEDRSQEDFGGIGLLPAYERVLGEWNAKLRVHCTNENRMIRTVVMNVVTDDMVVPLLAGEANVSEMMAGTSSSTL